MPKYNLGKAAHAAAKVFAKKKKAAESSGGMEEVLC